MYEISLRSKHCQEVHRIFFIECICAFTPGNEGVKLRYITVSHTTVVAMSYKLLYTLDETVML